MPSKTAAKITATVIPAQAVTTPRRKTRPAAKPVLAVTSAAVEAGLTKVAVTPSQPNSTLRPRPLSKLSIVLEMLETAEGASLSELVEVTGWLAHTIRAAVTGLRKRGFDIASEKAQLDGTASRYRIRSSAGA